ncbi:MAG: hypothetical protein GXO88_13385 [Chlorobi bacterium]|nr:hypothetical protein [Chlorobiota bacterium]
MKKATTYQFFLKSIIVLVLIGQFWTNTISYCYWLIDSKSELIELYGCDNNEPREEDDKKDKADKFLVDLDPTSFDDSEKVINNISFEYFPLRLYSEVTTPPPEHLLFHS